MDKFTGFEYLKIDVANSFGLDKENWDTRINWFNENQHNLVNMINEADEPAMFFAGLNAVNDVMNGRPSGYPISLDATSSGMQLLSLFSGCELSAQICNVIDVGKRMDAYTYIYDVMRNEGLLEGMRIERKDVKRAIMTALYSSIMEPLKVFGVDNIESFQNTMSVQAPGAWGLNSTFLSLWNSEVDHYKYVMPNNFHVKLKVMDEVEEEFSFDGMDHTIVRKVNQPIEEGRFLGAHVTHSTDGMVVSEVVMRCKHDPAKVDIINRIAKGNPVYDNYVTDYDNHMVDVLWAHYEMSGFLSARIVEHINRSNILKLPTLDPLLELVESLPRKTFDVLPTHDCFSCLPNYGNDLRQQVNTIYSDIGKSDLLNYILTQALGYNPEIQKIDPEMYKRVKNANYILS